MSLSFAGLFGPQSGNSRFFSGFVVLLTASLLGPLHSSAWAQGPPLDPPARVARLNLLEGAVSFSPAEGNAWTPARLNRPLTSGDSLWTGPRGRAELHTGSTALRMNAQTSLDFLALDDDVTQLRLAQGTLQLRVRALFEGQRLEIDTPNLAFVIAQPGAYRLDVDPASDTTRVVVQSGSGVIYGDNGAAVNLGQQQQAHYSGTRLTPAAPGAAWQDSFDAWAADRDRQEDQSVSARYVPRETIGYQQLDAYGDWRQDPAYGAVWLPRTLPANWAPYRVGHWDWIAPWGWTWVDDAPWGFAPFHYGRWAQIGARWAWVPGQLAPRPVYAPALVAFIGGSSGGLNWSLSIGAGGLAQPGLGWFPLAPGEAFRPTYRASPRYVTEINRSIVVNNTVNLPPIYPDSYRYQRQPAAVTAVSREDFARSRPVRANPQPLSATELGRAQVVADPRAIPQRAAVRERPERVAPDARPPEPVMARPVVRSRDEPRDSRGDGQRTARPDAREGNARATVPTAPAAAGAQPPAQRPILTPAPDRSAIETEQRRRREQQQQQQQQAAQQRAEQAQQRQAREQPPQMPRRDQELERQKQGQTDRTPGRRPRPEGEPAQNQAQ